MDYPLNHLGLLLDKSNALSVHFEATREQQISPSHLTNPQLSAMVRAEEVEEISLIIHYSTLHIDQYERNDLEPSRNHQAS